MRLPTLHHRPPAAGHRALRSLVAGLAAAAFAPAALADVLSVPGDFATIQAAVNAAADGDVIEIAPGDWAEAILVTGKQLELVGTGDFASDVAIGGLDATALWIRQGSDVTLRNLELSGSGNRGLRVSDSTALLEGVGVSGNQGNTGAGASLSGATVTIRDSGFIANASNAGGGAIYASGSVIVIEDTSFVSNSMSRGAIFAFESQLQVRRSLFAANVAVVATAIEAGAGSEVEVDNTVITNQQGGTPFRITADSVLKATNVTIAENDHSDASISFNSGSLTMRNSIVRDAGIPPTTGGGTVNASYSNVAGGLPGPGMIDADPLFRSSGSFELDAGSPCIDAADGNSIDGDGDFLGKPRFTDDRNVPDQGVGPMTYLDMGAIEHVPAIRYVKADATGTGDGTSWADAMTDLQDALVEASGDEGIEEIWIAAGTYAPDQGTGLRSSSFFLQSGLDVLGGFAGVELRRADRNPTAHETVLDGELDPAGPAGNVVHVVTAIGVTDAMLSGVTIRNGTADADGPDAANGAGILIDDGAPRFDRIVIERCESLGFGAAVFGRDTDAVFRNVRIRDNGWQSDPVGIATFEGGSPRIVGGLVHGNRTAAGGALAFTDVDEDALVASTTVWGNTTDAWCAGISDVEGELAIENSIIWGNVALDPFDGQPASQANLFGVIEDLRFSSVEGWETPINGTNGTDPRFVDPAGADGVPGTADDDLRLAGGSCLIDSGDNGLVPAFLDTDVAGQARFFDDPGSADSGVGPGPIVDRGAHEFGAISCRADVSGDGTVGFDDVLEALAAWGDCGGCAADQDCDGLVSFDDLLAILAAWGPCNVG